LLEAWLLGGFLLAGLLSLWANLPQNVLTQGVFFLSGGAALWCAVRSKGPRRGGRLRRWGQEVLLALALSLLLAVGWRYGARLLWGDVLSGASGRWSSADLFLVASGPEYLVFRTGVYLWQLWIELRRRRLLWSLTHVQVQVVVAFALIYLILFVAALFLQGRVPSTVVEGGGLESVVSSLILTILPLLSVALAGTVVVLVVVLPPTVLFAYLLARRTTRRLEGLAGVTAKLRGGEYGTRVEVEGEDEVAQLQADFNAMAGELERAVRDLQAERDKVAALLQSRQQLTASVSHELRTPVATLRGYLESSRARPGAELPEPLAQDLGVMEAEVLRLQGLIEDLFTLSRTEAGGLPLDLRPADVGALVRRRIEAMAPLAWQANRVEIVHELAADLTPAMADEGRLEQVLTNLLRNGVQHTLPGGIVAVAAAVEDEAIRIDVRDTGAGIAEQDLPHIWDRFYRGEARDGAGRGGAGLGLALVKELTEAMGGTVAVDSAPGQGSCFTVRLPRA
jgi:signal transduction histidine kinase